MREEDEEEDEANVLEPEELPLARQVTLKTGDLFMFKSGILALLNALDMVKVKQPITTRRFQLGNL